MTDDEIRAIFHELQCIGADLGRPPGLPLGARLGELTREVVEQHAFDILGGLVRQPLAWHHETLVAVQLGQLEEESFRTFVHHSGSARLRRVAGVAVSSHSSSSGVRLGPT